jgi:hypothetical protein
MVFLVDKGNFTEAYLAIFCLVPTQKILKKFEKTSIYCGFLEKI